MMFCYIPPDSDSFHTIPVPSVSRHSVEHSGCLVQYIRLELLSLRQQVESPVYLQSQYTLQFSSSPLNFALG